MEMKLENEFKAALIKQLEILIPMKADEIMDKFRDLVYRNEYNFEEDTVTATFEVVISGQGIFSPKDWFDENGQLFEL